MVQSIFLQYTLPNKQKGEDGKRAKAVREIGVFVKRAKDEGRTHIFRIDLFMDAGSPFWYPCTTSSSRSCPCSGVALLIHKDLKDKISAVFDQIVVIPGVGELVELIAPPTIIL